MSAVGQAVFLIEKTDEAVWFIENREAVDSVESILSALEIGNMIKAKLQILYLYKFCSFDYWLASKAVVSFMA